VPKRPPILLKELHGAPFPQDRLWRIVGPNFVVGFTEYNFEVTSWAPLLAALFKREIKSMYGANASYIIKRCKERGWECEPVID
jgi:hypothetical protein